MFHQSPQFTFHRSSRFLPAPLTFLEMEREVGFDPVELGESALGEAPEALNAIDVDTVTGKLVLGVVHSEVLVVAHVDETVVAAPPVRVDDGVERHLPADDGTQRGSGTVGDNLGVDSTVPLEDAEDRLLQGTTTTLELPVVTLDSARSKVALVELNLTDKLRQFIHLQRVDETSKAAEPEINRIPVDSGQLCRFRGLNIHAKVVNELFQLVGRDPNHMSSLISAGLLV